MAPAADDLVAGVEGLQELWDVLREVLEVATREGELELARHIETGERAVVRALVPHAAARRAFLDVAAAHGAGIECVGVASGHFSVEQLREAGADYVLGSLEERLPS